MILDKAHPSMITYSYYTILNITMIQWNLEDFFVKAPSFEAREAHWY